MAALAYVLLPLSGTVAFLVARSPRVRWHGLQAIAVGAAWGLAAYAGSLLSPRITQAVFALGALLWVVLIVTTSAGRDLRLPGARLLDRVVNRGDV